MDFIKEFYEIMAEQCDIALATSVDNTPNVRLVSFYFCPEGKTLYFASFGDAVKVKEFEKNNKVAFTTIPKKDIRYARTNSAVIKKSNLTIYDLEEAFCKKMPEYKELIDDAGDTLLIYEISFTQASVTSGMDDYGEFEL